ncbi:hypothetical protein, partial [Paenibacillus xylanexedens]|uniref:hypothetical protein n=1 Tax=Paenibacillus xylanexedens TaxID=528191 RepID=UPI0011A0A29D
MMKIWGCMVDDAGNRFTGGQREKVELMIEVSGKLCEVVYEIVELWKVKEGELRIVVGGVDVGCVV